ncbi:unnamed protein product, partial [Rotaria sordida]
MEQDEILNDIDS